MERMERVLSHFEQEAKEYDDIIARLIPNYEKMVSILVNFINRDEQDTFSVIDLGCGTGTLSKAISERFSNAAITCADISLKMAPQLLCGGSPCSLANTFGYASGGRISDCGCGL